MPLEIEIRKEDPKAINLSWDGTPFKVVAKSLFFNELRKVPLGLNREEFLQLYSQIEERVGKRYALYLLSQRSLLSTELEAKLVSKGISAQAAKAIAQHCLQKGYINDQEQIGRLVARELKKGRSAKAAFFKLKQKKGISEQVLREHLKSADQNDLDVLKRWLEKNAKKIDRSNRDAMRKLMAKLIRRGFPAELVFRECKIHDEF